MRYRVPKGGATICTKCIARGWARGWHAHHFLGRPLWLPQCAATGIWVALQSFFSLCRTFHSLPSCLQCG